MTATGPSQSLRVRTLLLNLVRVASRRADAGRTEDDDEFELGDSGEGASVAAVGKRKAADPPRQQSKRP